MSLNIRKPKEIIPLYNFSTHDHFKNIQFGESEVDIAHVMNSNKKNYLGTVIF